MIYQEYYTLGIIHETKSCQSTDKCRLSRDHDAGGISSGLNKYGTSYTYDDRGNLLTLTRNSLIPSTKGAQDCFDQGVIDNLTYTYNANSNQIQDVTDNAPSDFRDHEAIRITTRRAGTTDMTRTGISLKIQVVGR